jgi:hypothetical protein
LKATHPHSFPRTDGSYIKAETKICTTFGWDRMKPTKDSRRSKTKKIARAISQLAIALIATLKLQENAKAGEITEGKAWANTGYVRPAAMMKLTMTTPDSSNRIEINHFNPLNRGENSILFIDNTIYTKARAINSSSEQPPPFLESWGNTIRAGYRRLTNEGKSYIGINGGYDNVTKEGYYYQQLGIGFELIHPGITVLATANHPVGKASYESPGQEVQSTYNLQATVPLWKTNLALTTRIYYINNNSGTSAPGGLAELTYTINSNSSITYTSSYDEISGPGYVLQLKYLFRPPNRKSIPAGTPYSTALPFSQALGNTGSRIIRLTGSAPAYGN